MGPDIGQAIVAADRLIRRIGRLPISGWDAARFLKVPVVDVHGQGILRQDGGVTIFSRGDRAARILVNSGPFPGARLSWTVAHEIGHIALGHFDRGTKPSRAGAAAFDTEADAFAAELLLPAAVLVSAGWTDKEAAWRCGVSLAAARWRLRQLRCTPVDEASTDLVGLWGRQPVRMPRPRQETVADGWRVAGAVPVSDEAARAYVDLVREEEELISAASAEARQAEHELMEDEDRYVRIYHGIAAVSDEGR